MANDNVGSKARILYIMQELTENTDEHNRASMEALLRMLARNDISADRKTIYGDIDKLQTWGMDILYSREKPAGYYLASRDFELPEVKLLVDAVQSSKFITEKKSRELIKKLEKLTSAGEAKQIQRQVNIAGRAKTRNEDIYYNVDKISDAILKNRKIRFAYYKWSLDMELVQRNNGKPFEISPWALTWDDENYYMIGYDKRTDSVKHYRVDKMQQIDIMRSVRSGEQAFKNFDITKFAKSTFGMFGGKIETVVLECNNRLIGPIIDRFGKDIIIQRTDEAHFRFCHQVAVSGQFFGWLLGLGSGIKIVSPKSVIDEYKGILESAMNLYREDE